MIRVAISQRQKASVKGSTVATAARPTTRFEANRAGIMTRTTAVHAGLVRVLADKGLRSVWLGRPRERPRDRP